jgi:hypothetical protein
MHAIPESHPLYRMFAGLTEHAFMADLGVTDTGMVDYLTKLLARFVHEDAVRAVKRADGASLTRLAEMLVEAELPANQGERRREIYRHVGDYSLFFAGVFPEAISGRNARYRAETLHGYVESGRRSYYLASTWTDTKEHADEARVLRSLSVQYDVCVKGLRIVREELDHGLGGGPMTVIN